MKLYNDDFADGQKEQEQTSKKAFSIDDPEPVLAFERAYRNRPRPRTKATDLEDQKAHQSSKQREREEALLSPAELEAKTTAEKKIKTDAFAKQLEQVVFDQLPSELSIVQNTEQAQTLYDLMGYNQKGYLRYLVELAYLRRRGRSTKAQDSKKKNVQFSQEFFDVIDIQGGEGITD